MSLAHYLLQVNLYLVIFYCFYKLLLASETYFVLNRIYLLASGVCSLIIPFLRFEWFGRQQVARPIYAGVDQFTQLVARVSVIEDHTRAFNWGNFIVLIYLIGILFFTFRMIYRVMAVTKMLKKVTRGAAFSFFGKKVVTADLPQIETINIHEDIHVKQFHSVDVLFFEMLKILNWFNPVIYLYQKTIKNIHEYLADEAAAKFQGDKETYALLLLSQAFGVTPNALSNGFFTRSLIRKRIMMLHKERSKKVAILKYGLFVPLFALALLLSAASIRKNDQILAVASQIPLEQANQFIAQALDMPLNTVHFAKPVSPKDDSTNNEATIVNEASVSNDQDHDNALNGFYNYLAERIKYPAGAIARQVQGNTIVNFSVRHGKIANVTIKNELGEGCDEEVVSEILAYNDFFPKDGSYSLKVSFKLNGSTAAFKNEDADADANAGSLNNLLVQAAVPKAEEADQIYAFVNLAQPPTYPGGIGKFYEFIGKNIKYPAAAIDNEIQGNVHVSFTVEKDGSLTDIKVERKLGYGADEEAVRVIKLGKRWNPGIQNGRPVRVKYNIPIKFALDLGDTERKLGELSGTIKNNDGSVPLIIADNQVKDLKYVQDLNAKNIERIEVLKGSEAIAKYGKTAENGAIIIQSKHKKPALFTATLTNRN